MTREQDLQRRLVDWLTDGPVTSPTEVVDEAIERTVGRPQRHPLWGWLLESLDRVRAGDETRVVVLVLVLALTMLAPLAIAVPLAGGTRPAPEMDPSSVLVVTGATEVISESELDGAFEWSDPRLPNEAETVVNFEAYGSEADGDVGVVVVNNTWLLEGPDGSWSSPWTGWCDAQDHCRGMVTLTGHGAYEGFYAVLTEQPQEDASGTVTQMFEGAILAGEMPPVPDPLEPSVEAQASVDEFLTSESAAEPAAWTEATVEVLSDVGVIPLEAIPEDADHVAYVRLSVVPGFSGSGPGNAPQSWANLDYVASGSLVASPETARVYWRADGSVDEVPAGMTAGERSGDTVLSWNGAAAWEIENPGPEEYVVFSVLVADSHDPEVETELVPGIEWRTLDYIFPRPAQLDAWFSAPIAVTYQRITWEPGAQLVLGPDEVPMLSFIWLESGQLKTGEVAVDEVSWAELSGTISTGWTYRQERPPDGTVYVLRNEGDEPAVGIAAVLSHPSDT